MTRPGAEGRNNAVFIAAPLKVDAVASALAFPEAVVLFEAGYVGLNRRHELGQRASLTEARGMGR